MGMYDYVGHDGAQVKCFYIPCITLHRFNKETKRSEVCFNTMGGSLKSANVAPYETPYYNYGPDFAILDYRWYEHETPSAHIFKNGEWVETIEWTDMPDDYDYPPVTIGYYGDKIKIDSVAKMKAFVKEFIETDKRQEEILADKYEAADISERFINRDRMLGMSHEALMAEIAIRNEIESFAFKSTFGVFNAKWFDKDRDLVKNVDIIGLIVFDYLYEKLENRDNYRDIDRHEYEWYEICQSAIEYLQDTFDNPVEAYLNWCDKEKIQIKKQMVRDLFAKYTQKTPTEVIEAYEKYWDEQPDWRKQ